MGDFNKSIFFLDLSEKKEEVAIEKSETGQTFLPATDIFETPGGVHIMIELAGVDVNSLAVDVSGNRLIVQGSKEDRKSDKSAVFLCMERRYGQFRKIFEFMGAVNMLSTRASYRDGVLKIYVERCEEKRGKGKKVVVEIEGD